MAKLKVLMGTYQGERFLEEQLDSIFGQEGEHLSLVVSDDGSTDRTLEILENYRERFPDQIEILKRANPLGAGANFLSLLSYEAGKEPEEEDVYYFLCDQDDIWKPYKAKVMRANMARFEHLYGKDKPLLVHSDMTLADEKGREISRSFFNYQHIRPERNSLAQILVENPVTGGAAVCNRALLSYMKEMPKSCFMHDWWLALAACCFGHIETVMEPLSFYRQHGDNTLGAKDSRCISGLFDRFSESGRENVKENYRKMFRQAACFLKQYSGQLSPSQKQTLRAFLKLSRGDIKTRAALIRRYGFYKSCPVQTLASCFTMKV